MAIPGICQQLANNSDNTSTRSDWEQRPQRYAGECARSRAVDGHSTRSNSSREAVRDGRYTLPSIEGRNPHESPSALFVALEIVQQLTLPTSSSPSIRTLMLTGNCREADAAIRALFRGMAPDPLSWPCRGPKIFPWRTSG